MKKEVVLVLLLLISLPLVRACDTEKGGVEVEDKCYDCGKLDGVCPEDFDVECKVVDPDCNFVARWFVNFFSWVGGLFK